MTRAAIHTTMTICTSAKQCFSWIVNEIFILQLSTFFVKPVTSCSQIFQQKVMSFLLNWPHQSNACFIQFHKNSRHKWRTFDFLKLIWNIYFPFGTFSDSFSHSYIARIALCLPKDKYCFGSQWSESGWRNWALMLLAACLRIKVFLQGWFYPKCLFPFSCEANKLSCEKETIRFKSCHLWNWRYLHNCLFSRNECFMLNKLWRHHVMSFTFH